MTHLKRLKLEAITMMKSKGHCLKISTKSVIYANVS